MTRATLHPFGPAVIAASLCLSVPGGQQARAQSAISAPAAQQGASLVLESGSGRVISLRRASTNIFVADPKVVEVRPASRTSLFVFGLAPGRTVVAAMDATGAVVSQQTVTVQPSSFAASQSAARIEQFAPGQTSVQPTPSGASLSGQPDSPDAAERASATVQSYLADKQTVDDRMRLPASVQVSLRVRVAEMSRLLTRELGLNWSALGNLGKNAAIGFATANPFVAATTSSIAASYIRQTPGKAVDLNAVVDALAQDNLVHMLAEPNLTTTSGQPASFLVGGEFPIPISQNVSNGSATTTVVFKQYGISLSFVPTVLSDGRINLHVRPEVSELTTAGAVSISSGSGSLSIPALTVRRVDTTVELGSGQSFAIAGLLQDDTTLTGNGVPFLGDVPILGALFRSDSFRRSETELVILVTPYIVQPSDTVGAMSLPTDGWAPPDDADRILRLRQMNPTTAQGAPPPSPQQAGFVVQ